MGRELAFEFVVWHSFGPGSPSLNQASLSFLSFFLFFFVSFFLFFFLSFLPHAIRGFSKVSREPKKAPMGPLLMFLYSEVGPWEDSPTNGPREN